MLITSKYVLHVSSNIQSMCQLFITKYSSRADRIDRMKRLIREYKLLFGPLVETKKEKKRRIKLEKKGKIPPEKSNMIDTEFLWAMEKSGKKFKRITLITEPQNEQLNDKDQSSSEIEIKSSTGQNTKSFSRCESNQVVQEIGPRFTNTISNLSARGSNSEVALSNSNISDNENIATKYMSNFQKLPDIIIKNLPTFSIMGSKQECPTHSTEILSISGKDDLETIKFPSVTKILMESMSPESKLALEAWKERMIKKLGQEGFEIHRKGI